MTHDSDEKIAQRATTITQLVELAQEKLAPRVGDDDVVGFQLQGLLRAIETEAEEIAWTTEGGR